MSRIEKDCTEWAHHRLEELLVEAPSILSVTKVEGEVSVNVRKGRIRQIFDLTISLEIEDNNNGKKSITIADFMSDTEKEDFEVHGSGLTRIQAESLKDEIWPLLMQFKREVEEEHGKSLLVNVSTCGSIASNEAKTIKFNGTLKDDQTKSLPSDTCAEYRDTITINAPISEVWQTLTDPQRVMAWSKGTAQITLPLQVGSKYNLLHDNIIGKILEYDENTYRLTLEWRLKEWSATHPSKVKINMKQASGDNSKTQIDLRHETIPVADVESVKINWDRYYWEPIKTILGCPTYLYS